MVAGRVEVSGAKSTLPLFEGLKEALDQMMQQVKKHQGRWRVSKMLSAGTFANHFDRAKTSVLELKGALRDFLDQEMQDAQEAKLKEIAAASLDTSAKLESMEGQMAELKELLIQQQVQKQAEDEAAASATALTDVSIEEGLWNTIQTVSGVQSDIPFLKFAMSFESVFLKGHDLPSEQKRGLKISIDCDSDGSVGKPEWVKFYKKWQESAMPIEDYLLKLADEAPPTLYAQAAKTGEAAMAVGMTAAAEAKAKAEAMMGNVTMPKFGFGKKKA